MTITNNIKLTAHTNKRIYIYKLIYTFINFTLLFDIFLAWSIFVMELTTIEGHTESIQRKLYEPPLRRGLRSVLIHAHVGDTATNSFPSAEMDSYQGLVGRPGIDFPVLTHIPNTVFDCKNHGNGYFADLETRCQVSRLAIMCII